MNAASNPRAVTSTDNPRFKALRKIVQSSLERRKSGLSVLDGAHLVAAYGRHVGPPEQLVVSRSGLEDAEVRALLDGARGVDTILVSDALLEQLSPVVTPTGIMAVVRTPRLQPLPGGMDVCVMLEGLQDPGNLGSILRTCAAAGVRHVLLSRGSVHAWSPRVLRAGMGAHFALAIYEQVDIEAAARAFRGKRVATLQRAAQSVFDADLTGNIALMFGNEGAGLSRVLLDAADIAVAVPMPGTAESLNVAAAAAVCLFERVRQLSANRDHGRSKPGGR